MTCSINNVQHAVVAQVVCLYTAKVALHGVILSPVFTCNTTVSH